MNCMFKSKSAVSSTSSTESKFYRIDYQMVLDYFSCRKNVSTFSKQKICNENRLHPKVWTNL